VENSHERDPMLEQGQSVRSSPPEEEGAAETTCDELTTTPIPCSPALLLRGEVENLGVKLGSGRREGWGESVFNIWFYFSLSYSYLIGDKLNFFPKFNLLCP